ncbi:regulatory protein RecX [Geobacter sp. DSM 9736]|uniref:regulatory protein RecX n=1 Tax=Geobacter sp. DSM 9736 TaxID=1277350 RepID=UPI000B502369|nr:regulatory protein RecX [Geobacter sp. DSM 9736]SNB47217.1 regulatory protein [Geobacter sp. DSM 9736]
MEDEAAVFASALRLLARRDHSCHELERKLRSKGTPSGVIASVLERLAGLGYLDDRRFAERWAESAVAGMRCVGPRLRLELVRRGISEQIVSEVTAELLAVHEESDILTELLNRRFPDYSASRATQKETRRIIHYLQRRGFSIQAIMQALRATEGS